jgi:hypothetical protein
MHANFTPAEHACFLAAKTVAHATAYLDGRNDAAVLAVNARSMFLELIAAPDDPKAKPILDAARLLVVSMSNASGSVDPTREDRWQQVMGALVELVRHESLQLRQANRPPVTISGSMA